MSPGTEKNARLSKRAMTFVSHVCGLALMLAISGAVPAQDESPAALTGGSCGSELYAAQAGAEARGCCVLITADGPRCASASRGYCEMRAREAQVRFEFHEGASCSDLAQCR